MSLSLEYNNSRAADLRHNIEAVLSEIKEALPSGSKVRMI
jgi:ribosomal protein L1